MQMQKPSYQYLNRHFAMSAVDFYREHTVRRAWQFVPPILQSNVPMVGYRNGVRRFTRLADLGVCV